MVNHDPQLQRSTANTQRMPPLPPPYPAPAPPAHGRTCLETRSHIDKLRKTIDYRSTVVKYVQMLPPASYADNRSSFSVFAANLASIIVNKLPSSINRVLWNPSGSLLITGSQNGELTFWNGESFKFMMLLQAHAHPIRAVVWTYNQNWMVTGDDDGLIKYWLNHMNSLKEMKSFHTKPIRDLSFCRTDLKFCSCSDDSTIKVWDFAHGREDRTLTGHGWDVKCVDWHPTKSLLISGGNDNIVKLWDAKSGRDLASFYLHKGPVNSVKWNTNGNWAISCSSDHTIKLYDIRAMKELAAFHWHRQGVTALAWHPSHEDYFVSGSFDGFICHWLVEDDSPLKRHNFAHSKSILDLSWHPIGHLLCSGSSDCKTKFWCRNRPNYHPTPKLTRDIKLTAQSQIPQQVQPFTPQVQSFPQQVQPFSQQVQPFPPQVEPFPLQVQPFPQQVEPFTQQVQPFTQQVQPFTQQVEPFPQQVQPFTPQVQPFTLQVESFPPQVQPFPQQVQPFSAPSENLHKLQPPSPMPGLIHQFPPQGIIMPSIATAPPNQRPDLMGMQGSADQIVTKMPNEHFMYMNPMHSGSNQQGGVLMHPGTTYGQNQMPPMSHDHNPHQYQVANHNPVDGMSQLRSNCVLPPRPPPHQPTDQ